MSWVVVAIIAGVFGVLSLMGSPRPEPEPVDQSSPPEPQNTVMRKDLNNGMYLYCTQPSYPGYYSCVRIEPLKVLYE